MSTATANFTKQLHDNLEEIEERAKSLKKALNLRAKKLSLRFS